MNTQKVIIIVLAIAVLAAGAWVVLERQQPVAAEAVMPLAAPAPVGTPEAATADGFIVPVRYATLGVSAAGRVTAIQAVEGEWVAAGAPLLAIENRSQQAALAQAEANLAGARAQLAQVKAGARNEEVAAAEAQVAVAQARLDRLLNSPTPEQVASARQAVAVAQANLARAQSGATPEQLSVAAAAVQAAEAGLRQAQSAYDKVATRPDVGLTPQSLQLEQATIEYERAKASYQNLLNGATEAELNVYRQQVAQAQASLAEVTAGAHTSDIAAARGELQRAQVSLDQVRAGPRPEELAAAEAQVAAATAAVALAQAALDQTILVAPFAGEVAAITVNLGESVTPGLPLVRIGDTSAWMVETDTLDELDVATLAAGDRVTISVDALPGEVLTGVARHIQPASQIKRGDVTYKATLALDEISAKLYWGMSAAVRW